MVAVAAVAGVALTAAAGNWQLGRAHEKERLREAFERAEAASPIHIASVPMAEEDLRLRRVEVTGRFAAQGLVLLDNKVRDGKPGYEVVMPLNVGDSAMHVLVDRGWIPAGPDRARLPDVRTPAGTVSIVGFATVPGRFLELAKPRDEGAVWQNLTIERYASRKGIALQPVVVQQWNDLDDGLVRSKAPPDFGTAKHYGYAGQWFLFCGLIVILYVYFHVKSHRPEKNPADAPVARLD